MKIRRPLGGSTLVLAAILTLTQIARAVPSYSRQTGLPCASCHYAPPELTPFGRTFKAEGYTFATKAQVTDGLLNLSWWPVQNIDRAVQYTGCLRFNGTQTNYDDAGRDAAANNTVYLLARFVF